jgi:hypothetical protein
MPRLAAARPGPLPHPAPAEPQAEAKPPTIEDVGALYLFAIAVENCGDNLQQWGKRIRELVQSLPDFMEGRGDDA